MNIPDPISLTRELVTTQTVNPPGNEAACARYIAALLEPSGFHVTLYPNGPARAGLIATLPPRGSNRHICFSGHMDTVPVGQTPWTRDPFSGEVDGDRLYGRGTCDMKGGLAACIVAALQVAQKETVHAGISFILTEDEETGCYGGERLSRCGGLPARPDVLILAEPSSNQPVICHKGVVRFMLAARGVAAHGSTPELGINAIYKLTEAIALLRAHDFDAPAHPLLQKPTLNVGTIRGGVATNLVPDTAELTFEVRTVPSMHHSAVAESMKRLLEPYGELTRLMDIPAMETDASDPWVERITQTVRRHTGRPSQPMGIAYVTDAAYLAPAFGHPPTLILGPGDAAMAHKTDEYCLVSRIQEAVAIYADLCV